MKKLKQSIENLRIKNYDPTKISDSELGFNEGWNGLIDKVLENDEITFMTIEHQSIPTCRLAYDNEYDYEHDLGWNAAIKKIQATITFPVK